jgi:hypothetical protein
VLLAGLEGADEPVEHLDARLLALADGVGVDWLKSNFLKTELELGHCLRLPQAVAVRVRPLPELRQVRNDHGVRPAAARPVAARARAGGGRGRPRLAARG